MIALIVSFNQNPPKLPNEICANRLAYNVDYSTQKILSLIYAVVIAGISFIIGVAFLIFGTKLHLQLAMTKKSLNQTNSNNKVAI